MRPGVRLGRAALSPARHGASVTGESIGIPAINGQSEGPARRAPACFASSTAGVPPAHSAVARVSRPVIPGHFRHGSDPCHGDPRTAGGDACGTSACATFSNLIAGAGPGGTLRVRMNTRLNSQQIEHYRRDGFAVHDNLLTATELAELCTAVDAAVAALGKARVAGGEVAGEDGDTYYDRVFTQKLNLWKINPVIKRYMIGPEIGRMVCELSGVPAMRLWHDQALIKEPFGNPTGWHLDDPYWSFSSGDAISIWIALDDATLENGCLYYVPGSQRLADFRNAGIGENIADLFKIYPQFKAIGTVATPVA